MTRYVHLTENAAWRIGLAPRGPATPELYGLAFVRHRNGGHLFAVTEPWRWQVVEEGWREWAEHRAA